MVAGVVIGYRARYRQETMMRPFALVTWFLSVLAPDAAHAGRVSYDEMSFEELMRPVRDGQATLLIVELATPDHAKRAYRVPGGNGKHCPAYDFVEYRARVERVVRAAHRTPAVAAGESLVIVPANVPELVELARRECLEGVRKSPIWRRFAAGTGPADGARLMVVLRRHERYGWLEWVTGAWLPLAELPRVEAWLAAPPPP